MSDVLYLFGWNQFVAILMGLAVWLACRTRALNRRPAVCHGLWLLVLLKLVVPPILSLPGQPSSVAVTASTAPVAGHARAGCAPPQIAGCHTGTSAAATPGSQSATMFPLDVAAFTSWEPFPALLEISLLVTGVLWIAATRRFLRVRRLLQGSVVESGRAAELLHEVSRRFNLRAPAKLQIVDAPVTPMLWATPGNAKIVLPRQLMDSLSDDQLRNIFAHELAHFVRRDHWANLLGFVVTTLLWWNPIAWFARRRLSAAAEVCCDALALERLMSSRKSYAATLLTVVDSVTPRASHRSTFGIAFGESRSLRRRFEMIADSNVHARMIRGGWILLAIGFVALAFVPALNADAMRLHGSAQQAAPITDFCCPCSSS